MKKVYKGADLFKLLAAIGVIAIHTSLPFFNTLGRLGVPLFAIFTSFFFFKHFFSLEKKDISTYIRTFEKRIILLFLTWEIFYIPLAVKVFMSLMRKWGGIDFVNIIKYIICFFLPAIDNANGINLTYDANGWDISWYLFALIVGIPLFLFLIKVMRHKDMMIGIVCVLLEIYFILANEFNSLSHLAPYATHTCLRLFIYFYIGYMFAKYEKNLLKINNKKYIICVLLFLGLFLLENFLIYVINGAVAVEEIITTAPTSALIGGFALIYSPSFIHNSRNIRNLSTFLYCSQKWPLVLVSHFFNSNAMLFFILVLGLCLIGYLVYMSIKEKTKWRFWSYMV